MKTLQQHIDEEHGGNISAFARLHNISRPCAYDWIKSGVMWANGQAIRTLTAKPTACPAGEKTVHIKHGGKVVYSFSVPNNMELILT